MLTSVQPLVVICGWSLKCKWESCTLNMPTLLKLWRAGEKPPSLKPCATRGTRIGHLSESFHLHTRHLVSEKYFFPNPGFYEYEECLIRQRWLR